MDKKMKMLNPQVESIISNAWVDAFDRNQEFLLMDNILLSALNTLYVQEMMDDLDVDWESLLEDVDLFLSTDVEKVDNSTSPEQTPMFQRLLQFMINGANSVGKMVMIEDLLIALFNEPDTNVVFLMTKHGIDKLTLKELATEMYHPEDNPQSRITSSSKRSKKTALEQYATNLTELAKKNKLDPVIGRDAEVESAIQILCRKKKNNPLLVGESGVGKTSVVEKLANDIASGNVPVQIKDWDIFSIDLTAMVAGAKFRGDFEKRFHDILTELEKKGNCIAFIDEFHTMFGLGANSSNSLDATNIIKPALANGDIRIMGATTYDEAKNTLDKNKPMTRRFQKIDVHEPDEATTFKILKGLRKTFEEYHNVSYPDKLLEQIVTLSGKYLTELHFPDKAIDIVDEVGSITKLSSSSGKKKTIKESDLIDLISKKARVPVIIDDGDDKDDLVNLTKNIKSKLFGQDEAVENITDKVMMGRSGLNELDKPLGSFLLSGPSGCGKCLEKNTEVKIRASDDLYQMILKNRES